jgi:hypothetical protein
VLTGLSNAQAYGITLPTTLAVVTILTVARVSVIIVTYRDSDSDKEDITYTRNIDPKEVKANTKEV